MSFHLFACTIRCCTYAHRVVLLDAFDSNVFSPRSPITEVKFNQIKRLLIMNEYDNIRDVHTSTHTIITVLVLPYFLLKTFNDVTLETIIVRRRVKKWRPDLVICFFTAICKLFKIKEHGTKQRPCYVFVVRM